MCSVRFSRKPNIHDKREKKQNFMTKPSQYPEKLYTPHATHPSHHNCVARLGDSTDNNQKESKGFKNDDLKQ